MHDIHHGVKFFVEQIKQRFSVPPRRVLVAGCGSQGKEVPALAQLLATSEVVGFDLNLNPELHGTQGENWQLLTGDVLNIPFENQSFDTVFYYHVIEHVPDPARSLAEIARVLQPKGTLFIGTPNRRIYRLSEHLERKTALELERLQVPIARKVSKRIRSSRGLHRKGAATTDGTLFHRYYMVDQRVFAK